MIAQGESIMDPVSNPISRRNLMAVAAAGGLFTSSTLAEAQTGESVPEPRRPGRGGSNPGPSNPARARQNPDLIAPPATDHGTLPNLRFSFDDSHIRLESGGWTRQVTVRELGISKNIAGVNMRLNAGGVRELHWHKAAEWSYMIYGTARITAIDSQGRNFVDGVGIGDLWYFPPGIPHSIQGLGPDGAEFLLVFDDGDFDEDNTFLLSDWIKHTPPEVLAKNFGVPASMFARVPDPSELYIFPAPVPGPLSSDKIAGATQVPQSFSHRMMAQTPIRTKSGTVRITDSKVFPVSTTIAAALVEVAPRRNARAALAPEYGRVAVLHRRAGPHGRVRRLGPGPHLRLSGQRCRLRAVCHGALHREYRQHDAALPGNLQERLLR